MARLPRFILPGQPQHVIQRGNNRQAIFITENDYQFYLEKLSLAAKEHECQIHAYVLMTNHVHLLVSPLQENGLSNMMQTLGRYYVQYFNYHYQRTGTLWEGRYKATLINTEQYLFKCMRYIELNPVRARIVAEPSAYRWSSFHHNALGEIDPLLTPHHEYLHLAQAIDKRQANYRALFKEHLSNKVLNEIRESTNKAWVLGDSKFKEEIEEKLERRATPKAKGGDRKSRKFIEETNINRV